MCIASFINYKLIEKLGVNVYKNKIDINLTTFNKSNKIEMFILNNLELWDFKMETKYVLPSIFVKKKNGSLP